ncbi:MAG TPA: Ig-like domain-containing protein, partial [Longimicrobiales bacterium]|nr:Ig-like domain-containing protein [Longimicrobiales bacterium]
MPRAVPTLLLTTLLGVAACGGEDGPTGPVPVASVVVTPSSPSIRVGEAVQLTATPKDAAGNNLNRPITWTSVNSTVATVNSGNVIGRKEGSTTISAVSEGTAGSVDLTVTPAGVASVEVRPLNGSVLLGETLQMTATPRSSLGTPLAGRTVSWSSSDEAVATVSSSGLVEGLSGGPVTITATVEQRGGSAGVEVVDPTAPRLTAITPFPMVEGASATINGLNFGATVGENAVTVDGVAATVTAADGTTITFTVPTTGCRPARDVSVRVTADGKSGGRSHPIHPAAFTQVGVGEQVVLSGAPCLQLAATNSFETYVFGVFSASASPGSLLPAVVRGRAGLAADGAAAASAPPLLAARPAQDSRRWLSPTALPPHPPGEPLALDAGEREALRLHAARHLEARHAEAEALSARQPDFSFARSGALQSVIPPDAQLGQTFSVRVPPHFPGGCDAFTTITAELRVITARSFWLRQTGLTTPFSDGELQTLADAFEDDVAPVLEATFGSLPDTDGDGRIAFVSTSAVNQEGWLSYANLSDYLPVAECAASNEGDWAYVATPQGGTSFTAPFLMQVLPYSFAHDFTHVIQNRAVILANDPGARPDPWIEEGQATLGEEVFAHAVANPARSPRQNYGSAVIFDPLGDVQPYGMVGGLALYFGFRGSDQPKIANAPEACTWLQPLPGGAPPGPCEAGAAFSGSWAFLRWLTDHFGAAVGGDGAFHQMLIDASGPGFERVATLTGLPIETLLARFGASLYVDDRVAPADPLLDFPSWNLLDMHESVFDQARLSPRSVGYQDFSVDVSVRGGSTAYFRVSGSGRPATAMEVTGPAGVALSPDLHVWAV